VYYRRQSEKISMKIIAIDTADARGSLAALQAQQENRPAIEAVDLPEGLRSARALAPALRELLDRASWATDEIDLVAVTTGPGSFTGLRIGVTTAKTLAYAAQARCVSVSTLEVLAEQAALAEPAWTSGWAVLDAQRRQLFAAKFSLPRSGDGSAGIQPPAIVSIDDWLRRLKPGEGVVGPVLYRLQEKLPAGVVVAAESAWRPHATTVAGLALRASKAALTCSPFELAPQYLRLSAAEEKLQQSSAAEAPHG